MPNLPLILLLHFGFVLFLVVVRRMVGHGTPLRPLLLGLGVVVLYWITSPLGSWVQNKLPVLSALHWNWLGKVFALSAALIYWRASGLSRAEIGLQWRQRSDSLLPAVVVIALICVFAWTNEALIADGRSLAPERLAFQAIMPGLDEELVFRGLLLAFFVQAFGVGREIADGSFGWAAIAVTFLFAGGHGLFVVDGALVVKWRSLVESGVIGAGLLWLRTRTGSLVMPVVAHNLSNLGNSFF